MGDRRKPTVVAASPFNADLDARELHEAITNFGTNENGIASIFANRSLEQRQSIQEAYTSRYGKDMSDELGSKVSAGYLLILRGLFDDPAEFHAKYIHRIVHGILAINKATDLLEVLYPMNGMERSVVSSAYYDLYKTSLLEDVKANVSGAFQDTLVSLLQDSPSDDTPSTQRTRKYARFLASMTPEELSTTNNQLMDILVNNNHVTVSSFVDAYRSETGKDLLEVVINESQEEYREGLRIIISSAQDRWRFYADLLYSSLSGQRRDDSKLIYIIIFRCEMDLGNILTVFEKEHNRSLQSYISDVITGDKVNLLTALISGQNIKT